MERQLDILIVDDDPEILKAVSTILKNKGHRPMTTNAEETACLLELHKGNYLPDLIILDILLSGFDGRDICRKLKQNPKTKEIPIIMFSAYPNIAGSAKEAGADAFLSKPFGWRDLNYIIDELFKTKIR